MNMRDTYQLHSFGYRSSINLFEYKIMRIEETFTPYAIFNYAIFNYAIRKL